MADKLICGRCSKKIDVKKIRTFEGLPVCPTCSEVLIVEYEKKRSQIKPEQMSKIIVTTSHFVENHEIDEYVGIAKSFVVMGVSFIRDFLSSFRSGLGGRTKSIERELSSGYIYALDDLKKDAVLMEADAVISVKIDSQMEMAGEVGKANDKMVVVSAIGTAVKLK